MVNQNDRCLLWDDILKPTNAFSSQLHARYMLVLSLFWISVMCSANDKMWHSGFAGKDESWSSRENSLAVLTRTRNQSVLLVFILTIKIRENEYVNMKVEFDFQKLEKYLESQMFYPWLIMYILGRKNVLGNHIKLYNGMSWVCLY